MHALPAPSGAFCLTPDPIPAPPASCSLRSWGANSGLSLGPVPLPPHTPVCPWVAPLVSFHFALQPAFALQNSRILKRGRQGREAILPFVSTLPLIWVLPVFSGPITLDGSPRHTIPFTSSNPKSSSRAPPTPSSFLLGKMEVVGAGELGLLRFAARHRSAPSSCQIQDPPLSPPLCPARPAEAVAPPFLLGAPAPESGGPRGRGGLRARSVAPAPSFLLPRASGVAARPGLLTAGRKGLCLELGRWSGRLCPLPAFLEGHPLALV